jgi:O-antigen/teichoic acid export membrane protein
MMRELAKKSGVYFVGLTVSKVLNVLLFIILARLLGPQEFGRYLFFFTLVQLSTVVADMGLIQWFQKEAHEKNIKELLHAIIPARTFTLIISMIVVLVIVEVSSMNVELLPLFLLVMIPEAYLSVLDGYYFYNRKSFLVALKAIIESSLMILGILMYKNSLSLSTAVSIYLTTSLLSCAWYIPWRKFVNITIISFRSQLTILKSSSKYAYLIFTSFAYSRGDSLIIGSTLGASALGLYGSAYRYLESLSILPTALSHNLFPISAKEGQITRRHLLKITMSMIIIGAVASLFVFLLSEPLIVQLVGKQYVTAIPVLQILSITLLLFFVNAPLSTVVQSSKLIKLFLPWGIANTALNLLLNILFTPRLGITWAAWTMCITESTGLLINIWFINKLYRHEAY